MKKFLVLIVLVFGIAYMAYAQNPQPSNKKYEYVADVKCYSIQSHSYVTLGLYEKFSYDSYYEDELGRRHYKWVFNGHYLKDTNDCFYKVTYIMGGGRCQGFSDTYMFTYNF